MRLFRCCWGGGRQANAFLGCSTDLELVADIGKSLLEENNALRSRQDSLVNHSISPTKAFRPSSSRPSDPRPAGSPRPWRNSLNFPPPALSPRSKGLDASEEGTWHDNTPSSPTTPLRFTHRHRMSSSASISSLFAPSPRNVSSPAPQEVQALSQANYALLLQLTELEADSEKTQRDGNRKLRKLERELLALRQELSRAEERNDALEDVKEVGSGNEGRGETYRDWSKEEGGRIRDDEDESTPTFVRTKPTSPQDNAPALELPALHFAPATPPTHTTPTPVNASRRTPGDGRPRTPLSLVDSPVLPQTPDQTQDELVGLLMSKIDELREANEIITEERIDMVERLEQAQKDVDDFRRKCDELEDDLVQTIGWSASFPFVALPNLDANCYCAAEERQGEIGWRDEDAFSDTSPVRLKGNRRLIEQRKRTNIDTDFPFSNSDTSLSSTASDPYPNREREDSLESSRFFSDKLKRSLESELGSEWHHESSDDDNEHEEGSSATGSTSTPAKTLHAAYVSELDLDTSSEIFPHGSLRYSGPPDSETYEHLTRVVANLPAVWEDEKKFGRSPPPATGLLRSLPWAQESEDFWDESQYPELEETDFDRLESAEAVEQRRSRRASGSRSRSFSGTRIGSRMLRSRKRGGHSQAGGAAAIVSDDEGLPLSRREQALLRLGIYSSGEESGEERDEDVESVMSDFEHLERDGKRSADYWPVALRARYAPRMIATRAADSAVQHALLMITYIRFFLVLAVALAFALWQ